VLTRAYPIGIDVEHFQERAARPAVQAEAETLRSVGDQRLIVGIDRLDYTKGIPRRLLAYDRLLREHPEMHGNVRFIQVVVPSREGVRTYREVRNVVDATIGHINGAYGTGTWTPVAYQYRSLTDDAISALYLAADVMLVTPVRDGMNLVAKEFVASRPDLGGVLVLSEFAGAADELTDALIVNPYDLDGTASALYRALVMPREEIETRMRSLRERVESMPSERWAGTFLTDLRAVHTPPTSANGGAFATREELRSLLDSARQAPSLHLLLDYDGTLVSFTDVPSSAAPDAELINLLRRLAERPATDVHLVSGRSREQLEDWFGELAIALHAEHGLWSREASDRRWMRQEIEEIPPFDNVLALMRRCAETTPGALVERKSAGLAWHYRMAEPSLGEAAAQQLLRALEALARESPMDILHGDKVVEVRPRGIHKGIVAARVATERPAGGVLLAMGDDRTDEDLFEALPEGSLSVHVGPSESRVATRIETVTEARELLSALVNGR
jgi:trehalose 6-phosphate synthase/phosphatase